MLHEADRRERIDHGLLRRYHDDGDLRARDQLAERCIPLVRSIARKYLGRGEDVDDLQQAGMVGLVKAIDRYDVTQGHRFVSFAVPNIQGEIRRHFRDRTWAVHVPRSVQELDARLQGTRRTLLEETGHEASVDDLAAALEVTPADVRDAQAAGQSYRALSLDGPTTDGRTLTDGRGSTDGGYALVEDRSVTAEAFEVLDARERQVVLWRFRDELLQREIAERIGVSQMQVSRILKQAVDRMHRRVAQDDLGERAAA